MKKSFISIVLSIIMILGSVNAVYAESAVANPEYDWVCLRGYNSNQNVIYASNPDYVGNKFVSFIKFDLTDYLPQIYLSSDIKFSLTSNKDSANMNTPFDLSIVSDEVEAYDSTTITYANAGALLGDFPVFYHADKVGWGVVHTTDDIKSTVIDALEAGNNNTVVIKISTTDSGVAGFASSSIALNINYDTEKASVDAYYELVTSQFDFYNEAGISSDAVTDDFTLPASFGKTNITWESDNTDVISITDNNACVTQQSEDVEAKLTATFSYKDGSAYQKEYTVKVPKAHMLDLIADKFNSSYVLTSEPLEAVTGDVTLASDYDGAALTWTSSNENVVHPVTGRVVPSVSADTSVILTPTISSDGDSRELNPINITVKKYDGKVKTLATIDMATIYGNNGSYDTNIEDTYLYAAQGYKPGGAVYHFRASFIKFDISDIKDAVNDADSVILNLNTYIIEQDIPEDKRIFNVYVVDNNNWDNTLTYNDAYSSRLFAGTPAPYEGYNSSILQPAYSSPAVDAYKKCNTSDIKDAVKEYISKNPDATHITFMLQSDYQSKYISFYGTAGNDAQKPSLEIRYNYETPSIEAAKNTDGTYSAVIKTNDTLDEGYNVYFAAYSEDNVLVGIDVKADIASFESGATRLTADAEKFTTQGATKIKCIITKADGITPLWKNDELKID